MLSTPDFGSTFNWTYTDTNPVWWALMYGASYGPPYVLYGRVAGTLRTIGGISDSGEFYVVGQDGSYANVTPISNLIDV